MQPVIDIIVLILADVTPKVIEVPNLLHILLFTTVLVRTGSDSQKAMTLVQEVIQLKKYQSVFIFSKVAVLIADYDHSLR